MKKKFMICALGLCVMSGNVYAHNISVQKLKYDNDQGIATKWSKSDGDAIFSLYKVVESDKPMELAAKIEKDGGDKVGEMSITDDGVANFTGIDTGYYVLVETKYSGRHAKPMYFYLDKNVNVYTKNSVEDSGDKPGDKPGEKTPPGDDDKPKDNPGDKTPPGDNPNDKPKDNPSEKTPPGKNLKDVPSLIKKTGVYKTVKHLADTGLTSTTAYLSAGFLAVVAIFIYRNKRKKK